MYKTYEELKSVAFGFKFGTHFNVGGKAHFHKLDSKPLPASVDWRTKGVITSQRSGKLYSCWAFSTIGVLEGQHSLATGKLVSLSEQNLVDCTKQEGNFGCGGGWPFDSYEYVIRFQRFVIEM